MVAFKGGRSKRQKELDLKPGIGFCLYLHLHWIWLLHGKGSRTKVAFRWKKILYSPRMHCESEAALESQYTHTLKVRHNGLLGSRRHTALSLYNYIHQTFLKLLVSRWQTRGEGKGNNAGHPPFTRHHATYCQHVTPLAWRSPSYRWWLACGQSPGPFPGDPQYGVKIRDSRVSENVVKNVTAT